MDKLALSQDGNQRVNRRYINYVYDKLGRVVRTLQGKNETSLTDLRTYYSTKVSVDSLACDSARTQMQTFYDDYSFLKDLPADQQTKLAYQSTEGYSQEFVNPGGMLTGKRIYYSSNRYTTTVYYYDDKGRIVQTRATNHLGGYDISCAELNFSGNPLKILKEHSTLLNSGISEVYNYTYDHAGRLLRETHQLNNGTVVILSQNNYDELGRLSSKKINNGNYNMEYSYNLRGEITNITSPDFNQNLYYTGGPGTACYNGNISAMTWNSDTTTVRGYKYQYDDLNRLTNAQYGETQDLSSNQARYSETMEYDNQGNITSLQRNGLEDVSGIYGTIDELSINRTGNQLKSISDASDEVLYAGNFSFKDGDKSNIDEYRYDKNGNMIKDSNKGILNIEYDLLNLPSIIQFSKNNSIEYLYGADGVKRQAQYKTTIPSVLVPRGGSSGVKNFISLEKYDYCDNMIYGLWNQNTILFDGGYIKMEGTNPTYYYFIKDYEGNTRVVIDQSGDKKEIDSYYPFGGLMAVPASVASSPITNIQPYKYNGKELNRTHGLDWYDYGARFYDPELCQWHSVDMLAEMDYSVSPYAYCAGNPVNFIDPFGLWKITSGGYITEDPHDIELFTLYLSIEKTVLNNDPTINQMGDFVKGEMSDKGLGKLSDGSNLVPEISVKGYKEGSGVQWSADSKSVDNAWHSIQRDLTPDALDPRTLNKNIIGSYPGPCNPKKYSGKDDYSYIPSNPAEIPAYLHDKAYDKIGIKGIGGLLTDPRSISADWNFVQQELVTGLISPNFVTRMEALGLGYGLGMLAAPKTIINYLKYPFNKK
jgi:RHS repeat-associated protein